MILIFLIIGWLLNILTSGYVIYEQINMGDDVTFSDIWLLLILSIVPYLLFVCFTVHYSDDIIIFKGRKK